MSGISLWYVLSQCARKIPFLLGATGADAGKKKGMPKREFSNSQEFEDCLGQTEEIIIDGFENLTQRPESYDSQRVKYSGKKSTHTHIALLFSNKKRRIYYVSAL